MKFWNALAFLGTEHLLEVARASDECGYHGVLVSDHVFFPSRLESRYPYSPTGAPIWASATPWPDPWVLVGAMAAVTSTLRFSTNIYVAPARNLFTVAKAVSTAAVLSGGRVALGAGAGWMREEFDQLGQNFVDRGPRLAEMIDALRALWSGGMVEFHGEFYDFPALEISPVPAQPIPVYGGGHSPAALRRAAALDGWIGNAYALDELFSHVDALHALGAGDEHPFEIIVGALELPTRELCERLEERGVTGLICAPWMTNRTPSAGAVDDTAVVDAVRRFAERVVQPLSGR